MYRPGACYGYEHRAERLKRVTPCVINMIERNFWVDYYPFFSVVFSLL